jgi:ABC-type antimicrobial peptide transport system permease subunit
MALGATRAGVVQLMFFQLARPVGAGLLVGGGGMAIVGSILLATPAAELISATVNLFDPLAYAISLSCTTAACLAAGIVPALRASRTNPVSALRLD